MHRIMGIAVLDSRGAFAVSACFSLFLVAYFPGVYTDVCIAGLLVHNPLGCQVGPFFPVRFLACSVGLFPGEDRGTSEARGVCESVVLPLALP